MMLGSKGEIYICALQAESEKQMVREVLREI